MKSPGNLIVSNSISFYLINFSDYFISLILLPFFARIILPEGIGILGLASTLGLVCVLIIDYGFPLSATKTLASNLKSKKVLFSKVFYSKILLIIPCVFICLLSSIYLPILQNYRLIIFLTLINSIFNGLTPVWYFQGVQKVLPFAKLKIISRIITVIPIFIFVKSINDIWIIILLQTLSSSFICTISNIWVLKKIKIVFVSINDLKAFLKYSWHSFSLTIVPSICSLIIFFWLSTKLSIESIGLISSAERIFKAIISLFGPISQAIYPFLISQLSINKSKAIHQTKIVFYLYFFVGVAISLVVILYADKFIEIYLGKNFESSAIILKIFAICIPIIKISHVLGRQWMLSIDLDRIVNRAVMLSSLILFMFTYLLFEVSAILSFPISFLLSEVFLLIFYFAFLQSKKIGFWNNKITKKK